MKTLKLIPFLFLISLILSLASCKVISDVRGLRNEGYSLKASIHITLVNDNIISEDAEYKALIED